MVILSKTYGEEKNRASISLDDFQEITTIKKSHISRSLALLEERNVIRISSYRSTSTYGMQKDAAKWRSYISIKMPDDVKAKHEKGFEKWFERYPLQIHKEDAKVMYLNLIHDGESPENLEDALTGYIRFELARAARLNKEPDEWTCMFPTTFLRSGKYEEYVQFKDLKKKARL